MRLRATLTAAATLLAGGTTMIGTTTAGATGPTDAPVVAVIDSGVNPFHQEFNYGGATSTSDQFVAWWDFTTDTKPSKTVPAAGQLWDTAITDPYDDFGHGSMSAAMVGGLGTSTTATKAAAPGALLAIAKVVDTSGGPEDLEVIPDAIHWAVDTVHADVINISIGAAVPTPATLYSETFQAISYARSKGVLVTIANGNGFGGVGLVPGDPGWASAFSCSPDALAVGPEEPDPLYKAVSLLHSTDPELVATFHITYPLNTNNTGYKTGYGTSASAPWVAGFASRLIAAARAAGTPLPVDRLETLLKYASTDLGLPPQSQGYGALTLAELPAAEAHAAAGTLPVRPSPDVNGTYVETVGGTLRTTWCETLDFL